jgi:hypothetical protein
MFGGETMKGWERSLTGSGWEGTEGSCWGRDGVDGRAHDTNTRSLLVGESFNKIHRARYDPYHSDNRPVTNNRATNSGGPGENAMGA